MIGRCDANSEADVDAHRGAAFREFAVGRAWPDRTAALAVMAIQPFDAVEPISRDWEVNTRAGSMAFWRQLHTLHDPGAVAALAREALMGYRETAIAAGEPYYADRYHELLEVTQDGGHLRSSDRATAVA